MDVPAIEVQGLRKAYGDRAVIDGLDLTVRRGEIVAVLGPNGAGKTTLLEVLEGHRPRDGGRVGVLGADPATPPVGWRARLGVVLQDQGVIAGLSVAEAVDLYGGYYPRRRATAELLVLVGLADRADDRVERLSGGAQRRLDVALGLVGCPELLFLDEPTTGFDPDARRRLWDVVRRLRADGLTVVLTTHYLDEAAALADRIVVLREGGIVAEGRPADLARGRTVRVEVTVPPDVDPPPLPSVPGDGPRRWAVEAADLTATLAAVVAWSQRTGASLDDLAVTRRTLDDAYLELIA